VIGVSGLATAMVPENEFHFLSTKACFSGFGKRFFFPAPLSHGYIFTQKTAFLLNIQSNGIMAEAGIEISLIALQIQLSL